MKPLRPIVEAGICRDYMARRARRWRYTTGEIASRYDVSAWTVNLVRLRNGLWRNECNSNPQTRQLRCARAKAQGEPMPPTTMFACPYCEFRSREQAGHELCLNREVA
jgi:hypothetical protein